MNKAILHFFISALFGLGIGYIGYEIIFDDEPASDPASETSSSEISNEQSQKADQEIASVGDNILSSKGCLGCHSVSDLNLQGGATGPDLSDAFVNVEGKHGKPITDFLKEPTSAVMSGVIGGSPLTEDEINQIVEVLQEASEVN